MKKKLRSILLIDDHTPTNYLHEMLLKEAKCAHQIVTTYSSDKALDFFRYLQLQKRSFPELVFLDINMPGWDGLDFLEMVTTFFPEIKTNTKIVVLTSDEDPNKHRQLRDNQLIMTIKSKPLTEDIIENVLQQYFNQNHHSIV